ncbi:MAG: hypothetical protein U0892_23600 [Pirellulales bacterium]
MSRRKPKAVYWQDAPMPREQMVLIPGRLDAIPDDHPVRLLDELVDLLDWCEYESAYHGRCGQPPIHPSVLCKVLLFAMIRRIRSSRRLNMNCDTRSTSCGFKRPRDRSHDSQRVSPQLSWISFATYSIK